MRRKGGICARWATWIQDLRRMNHPRSRASINRVAEICQRMRVGDFDMLHRGDVGVVSGRA
jgi:hypothetical protein